MDFISYLDSLHCLDEELRLLFEQHSITKKFKKNDVIFKPGSYLKHVYFIESGITRAYYYKGSKEITHCFFGENKFCTGVESVYYNKPSLFGFQALTPSSITLIPFELMQELKRKRIEFNEIIEKILLDNLIEFSKRLYNNQFETAQDRYMNLLKDNPELLQNVSLGHIASYLGITQQTLSVIRASI